MVPGPLAPVGSEGIVEGLSYRLQHMARDLSLPMVGTFRLGTLASKRFSVDPFGRAIHRAARLGRQGPCLPLTKQTMAD